MYNGATVENDNVKEIFSLQNLIISVANKDSSQRGEQDATIFTYSPQTLIMNTFKVFFLSCNIITFFQMF